MKEKTKLRTFLSISLLVILALPIINWSESKENNKDVDIIVRFFNTDILERHINFLIYKLFSVSLNSDNVIVGDDDFLFLGNHYANVIRKTIGVYRPNNDEIEKFVSKLRDIQDWYMGKDIKFVIVIAPNKHSVYKNKLPNWIHTSTSNITDDIVEFSIKKGINLLDLRPLLHSRSYSKQIYFKTDTHWNKLGASIAYDATINYINERHHTSLSKVSYDIANKYRGGGDLANLLKISKLLGNNIDSEYDYLLDEQKVCWGKINKATFTLDKCSDEINPTMAINAQPQYMINSEATNPEKLLYICDSFGTAASKLYNATFRNLWKLHYNHISENNILNLIETNKPDIVIYQVVERSLYPGWNPTIFM